MVEVKIPATSANLGPGFDCLGIALDMYNDIKVEEIDEGLEISIPVDDLLLVEDNENNLVYSTIKEVFHRVGHSLKGIRIKQQNGIPITRGLGSSAACIVGGIIAGNALSGNQLSMDEMISLAAEMDGHPDNVTPAFVGGMIVACMQGRDVHYIQVKPPSDLKYAVMIPDFTLATSMARKVLPAHLSIRDAVYNISRASLMTASMMSGQTEHLWAATDDRLHQPYRKKLIPHWEEIVNSAKEMGAKGIFLSGAGPTMIALLDGHYQRFQSEMTYATSKFAEKWDIHILDICYDGAQIINNKTT